MEVPMNDEFRGHSPLPNEEELAWMSVQPFAAIRRLAVLVSLAFAVAMTLGPTTQPVIPEKAQVQPEPRERPEMQADGGVLVEFPAFAGMTLSALRPLE
jgi:hypothetical protein